jgi:hypothetical protein
MQLLVVEPPSKRLQHDKQVLERSVSATWQSECVCSTQRAAARCSAAQQALAASQPHAPSKISLHNLVAYMHVYAERVCVMGHMQLLVVVAGSKRLQHDSVEWKVPTLGQQKEQRRDQTHSPQPATKSNTNDVMTLFVRTSRMHRTLTRLLLPTASPPNSPATSVPLSASVSAPFLRSALRRRGFSTNSRPASSPQRPPMPRYSICYSSSSSEHAPSDKGTTCPASSLPAQTSCMVLQCGDLPPSVNSSSPNPHQDNIQQSSAAAMHHAAQPQS